MDLIGSDCLKKKKKNIKKGGCFFLGLMEERNCEIV